MCLPFILAGCEGAGPTPEPPPPSSNYTISGIITVASNTFTDSDLNDSYASGYAVSNNSIGTAQFIANPATVGGFVKGAGATWATGQLASDTADFYAVGLSAGETVKVYIADASEDLDLRLYNSSGTLVQTSDGSTQLETVTAATTGSYYVEVYPYFSDGASNYILTAGSVQIAAAQDFIVQDNFVPGEILVRFKEGTTTLAAGTVHGAEQQLGMQHKSGSPGRVSLMSLGTATQRQQSSRALGYKPTEGVGKYSGDETKRLKFDTLKAVQALRKRTDVASADVNFIHHAFGVPTDTYYGNQWHYPLINLLTAWNEATDTDGSGAVIAVIDTGVLLNHPDLNGQFSADGGYDFISNTYSSNSNDGDGIDANPDDPGDNPGASSFHGTHVAGTIAAETCMPGYCTQGSAGVAGIAPKAKVMPLRVLGLGGGYDSDIIQAMYYAADLTNNSGTKPSTRGGQRADIINMSLGGGGYSQAFQDVVTQVRNAGVIIIAAAGNSATSTASYPAAYSGVVAVSAVGPTKSLAYYSNYGSWVDVAAPGGDQSGGTANGVYSTVGSDAGGSIVYTYTYYQGTSMAAPHVAGVAALMVGYAKSLGGTITPATFDNLLAAGDLTDDIGTAGRDNSFGYGLINASKALTAAGGSLDVAPVIQVNPSAAAFGLTTTSMQVTITNGGSGASAGDLTSVAVSTSGAGWLGVSTTTIGNIAAGANTSFNISVDRTGLSAGSYSGTVTVSAANANSVVVPVSMQVATLTGDAGLQYITLINASTGQHLDQIPTTRDAATGHYTFSFADVPEGEYTIETGSDMDNDYYYCDAGESCGVYQANGVITVSGSDVGDIQFGTGYSLPSGLTATGVGTGRVDLKSNTVVKKSPHPPKPS